MYILVKSWKPCVHKASFFVFPHFSFNLCGSQSVEICPPVRTTIIQDQSIYCQTVRKCGCRSRLRILLLLLLLYRAFIGRYLRSISHSPRLIMTRYITECILYHAPAFNHRGEHPNDAFDQFINHLGQFSRNNIHAFPRCFQKMLIRTCHTQRRHSASCPSSNGSWKLHLLRVSNVLGQNCRHFIILCPSQQPSPCPVCDLIRIQVRRCEIKKWSPAW